MSLLRNKLTRGIGELTDDKAEKIVKSVDLSFSESKLALEKKINKLDNELEDMLDMSADARTTTRGTVENFDADHWRDERLSKLEEKRLLEIKLSILKEDREMLLKEESNEDS